MVGKAEVLAAGICEEKLNILGKTNPLRFAQGIFKQTSLFQPNFRFNRVMVGKAKALA